MAVEAFLSAQTPWYSHPATGVFHRGATSGGTAHTSCGITPFLPQARKPVGELTAATRCPECWAIHQIPRV